MIILFVSFTIFLIVLGNLCIIESISSYKLKEKLSFAHLFIMGLICYYFAVGLIVAYIQLTTGNLKYLSKLFWY